MSFRRLFAAAITLLVVTGCAQETVTPGGDRPQSEAPGLPPLGVLPEADDIRKDLETLGTAILPSQQSFLSKFDALIIAFNSPEKDFGGELQDLLGFLALWIENYQQPNPPPDGDLTDCVDGSTTDDCQTVGALYAQILYDIKVLVGLNPDPTATICVLPDAHSAQSCLAAKDGGKGTGFVFFPEGIFNKLTFVSVKSLGESAPVNSGLDEYGYTVQIKTAPISSFKNGPQPTVVVCVDPGLSPAVLNRLLVGHRRDPDKYPGQDPPPFSLLPEELPSEVVSEASGYCGGDQAQSVFGLSAASPLNRILVRAGELLLPERLFARTTLVAMNRVFSGASGSPEEFSTFRAVDRGVTGAGGSPEEFAPQAAEEMLPTANAVGTASPDPVVPGPLTVTVTTVGTPITVGGPPVPLPVARVGVFFELVAPGGAVAGMESDASFDGCAQAVEGVQVVEGVIEVTTNDDGEAVLPCLNFGTLAGYKKLQVTFDPAGVDDLVCMIGALGGDCDPAYSEKYLIQTVAGPATGLAIEEGNNQIAPAYSAVPVAPKVVVTDKYDNVVSGETVRWSANVGTIEPYDDVDNKDTGTTTTGAYGATALISWTLGIGGNTLLAEITTAGDPVSVPVSVTFNATGTFGLSLDNACVTGGQKDDITKHRFYFPHSPNRAIQAIGVNLSSNGAPGQSENYEVTLVATRELGQQGQNQAVTESRTVTARLQSGSNASKGAESEVIFDFGTNPLPARGHTAGSGRVTVQMSVVQIVNVLPQPLSGNRVVNMNAGSCPAGQLNCNQNQRRVPAARTCDQTESQIGPPLIENFRRAFAGRVYTSP